MQGGYAPTLVTGVPGATTSVRRIMWVESGRELPEDFYVHACRDNVRCVNPEHLSAGRGFRRPGDKVERFWAKVERRGDDECWPWRGQLATQRYADGRPRPERQARFAVSTGLRGDKRHRTVTALRYMWELVNGPLDEEERVHLCPEADDCVNPT